MGRAALGGGPSSPRGARDGHSRPGMKHLMEYDFDPDSKYGRFYELQELAVFRSSQE